MDDIRPPRQPNSQSPYPNRSSQPTDHSNLPSAEPTLEDNGYNHANEGQFKISPQKTKKSKGLVMTLVLFIILFLVTAGFAAWLYFVEMKNMQTEIDDLKQENSRLVQQVRSLEYDNRDLNQKLLLEQQNNLQLQSNNEQQEQSAPAE